MRGRLPTALAALLWAGLPAAAEGAPDGLVVVPPVLASAAAPLRPALIVAPAAGASPRSTLLRADAAAYRDLLRLLGFEVSTLDAGPRPAIEAGLNAFARSVRRDADVAVFLLGDLRPVEGGLALMPAEPFTAAPVAPEVAGAEGVRPGDALRRIAARGARAVVVVAEDCTGDDAACAAGLAGLPEGVGILLARRLAPPAGAAPPGPASLRRDLVPAMTVEGRTFPQLAAALTAGLAGGGLALDATPAPGFAFLPAGFLAGLPLACNAVDPDLGAAALRDRAPLDLLVTACSEAAARYGFAPFFGVKLAAVRDQAAAQKGLAGCAEAAAYLAGFPEGRYRAAVAERHRACAVPPPAPAPPIADDLGRRAAAAVADYFRRHDYSQGDSFGALARLYPRQLRVRGAVLALADHLRRLGTWYGAFDSVQFKLLPDSLDLSGCAQEGNCLVRGRYESQRLRAGDNAFERQAGDFTVRFDLKAGQVTAECGVTDPPGTAGACE